MLMNFANSALNSDQPERFQILPDRAEFRPVGRMSLSQAVKLVTSSILRARALKKSKLLISVAELTGFESPDLSARYFFIREWAAAAQGEVRIALVARPEMIDPEKFGVTVAANAGLTSNVFASEPEALAWLQNVA